MLTLAAVGGREQGFFEGFDKEKKRKENGSWRSCFLLFLNGSSIKNQNLVASCLLPILRLTSKIHSGLKCLYLLCSVSVLLCVVHFQMLRMQYEYSAYAVVSLHFIDRIT